MIDHKHNNVFIQCLFIVSGRPFPIKIHCDPLAPRLSNKQTHKLFNVNKYLEFIGYVYSTGVSSRTRNARQRDGTTKRHSDVTGELLGARIL